MMMNLKEEIDRHCRTTGETVEGFVIGLPKAVIDNRDDDLYSYIEEDELEPGSPPKETWGKTHGPKDLRLLDYDTSRPGGYHDPNPVYIWTNKSILFLDGYDSPSELVAVPRDPVDCLPKTFGGGY